jgi:DNA polymerase-3 subunit delta
LRRSREALAQGKPLPMVLREQRVWGVKERLFERVLPLLSEHQLAHLVEAAQVCDGIVKGLKHPAWPLDPWDALKRLMLLTLQAVSAPPPARGRAPVLMRLALEAQ